MRGSSEDGRMGVGKGNGGMPNVDLNWCSCVSERDGTGVGDKIRKGL